MPIYHIPKRPIVFPDPHMADDDGLLAIGGDLCVERLLLAYNHGIFPWFSFRDNDEPWWFCPQQRFVLFPDRVHISHSMRSLIRKDCYKVTLDADFSAVISHCSTVAGRDQQPGAWLGEDIIKAYTTLHRMGFAHSVEVWNGDRELVGGLYGVTINRCFMGESMFSEVPSASKLALIALALHVRRIGGRFIDCQIRTDHLASMGGTHIPYDNYMELLHSPKPQTFDPLTPAMQQLNQHLMLTMP